MQARREDPENQSRPAWSSDRLDSPNRAESEPPYFDKALDAWVFSRYADVLAAFRSSTLAPIGPIETKPPDAAGEDLRQKTRAETLEALSPTQLRAWREEWTPEIQIRLATLPIRDPIDLIGDYARPLCLTLAAIVTGISRDEASRLDKLARKISAASAEPFDDVLHDDAKVATTRMHGCFHAQQAALRDSTFVALSQTMPCLLGNAWFALLRQPREWRLLHSEPVLMEQAVEELLRYAGPIRILFRQATADTSINGSLIHQGNRVILRLVAANHDPGQFTGPDAIDITRRGAGHLALGAGPHACVGASLIRMATTAITQPMLERFAEATLAHPVDWQGGSTFRFPASLCVRLSEL